MIRTHTVKLYPNQAQVARLNEYLAQGRYVYNKALSERKRIWEEDHKSVTRYDQQKVLTQWRAQDERLSGTPVTVERDALWRVDLAYQRFFTGCKGGRFSGFPRFKSRERWRSFSHSAVGSYLRGNLVRVPGITKTIPCRGARLFDGVQKLLRILKRATGWFAQVVVDDGLSAPPVKPVKTSIGLDLGLNALVTTSDGEHVPAPKFYRRAERRLKRTQRRLSKCKRGSKRRASKRERVARLHQRVHDLRHDFHHQLSRRIVDKYDLIAVEKLNVSGMKRHRKFSKSISDAGWSSLVFMLRYKAESAGAQMIEVNPSYTSQLCSSCGALVPKLLRERTHRCPGCGLILDRDQNAALNILKRALASQPGRGCVNDDGAVLRPLRLEGNSVEASRYKTAASGS